MTWGALLRALLTDPLAWGFALIVGGFCAFGGYFYGHSTAADSFEQKQTAAENTELHNEVKVMLKAANELNEVDKNYGKEKKVIAANTDAVNAEFNGLRLKPLCANPPATTASASRIDGTGNAAVVGSSTSEVDFAGIERKIVELGNSYDNALNKIDGLQAAILVYKNACGSVALD